MRSQQGKRSCFGLNYSLAIRVTSEGSVLAVFLVQEFRTLAQHTLVYPNKYTDSTFLGDKHTENIR